MIHRKIKAAIRNRETVKLKGTFATCGTNAWLLHDVYVNGCRLRDHMWIRNSAFDARRTTIVPGDKVRMAVRLCYYTPAGSGVRQVTAKDVLSCSLQLIKRPPVENADGNEIYS